MPTEVLAPSFTVREVIDQAMEFVQASWRRYLALTAIMVTAYMPIYALQGWFQYQNDLAFSMMEAFGFLVSLFFSLVMTRFSLEVVDGKKSELTKLFSWDGKLFLAIVLGSLTFGLLMVLGLIALIVPGIIVATMFGFYNYVIVDTKVGAIESLKLSQALTQGNKLKIFGLGLLYVLASLVAVGVPGLIFLISAVPMLSERTLTNIPTGLMLGWLALLLAVVIGGLYLNFIQLVARAYMYRRMVATRKLE